MHTYDVPRRPALPSVPSARPAQDPQGGPSATPIYDALYAEYVKTFRSLPGDRSGEDDLGFTAFGSIPQSTGSYGDHRPGSFSHSYSAYSAGAQSARQQSQWQRVGQLGQIGQQHSPAHAQGQTQSPSHAPAHTPTAMVPVPVPAALPPGTRRGL
ncbi:MULTISPECIES: hypothetical protein [Streptomyces]|uniref:hypothetical protein n=1 Tax=Streptomyces TaxID=1883 RepID=UPI0015872DC9|nr:hypothetical protein [Streptomyces sp. CAI-85]MBO7935459.1 hypothetical protein [Streptomyces sp. S9]NUV61838.1 hypothetical protein [Streptomyces sp. CAI-85]